MPRRMLSLAVLLFATAFARAESHPHDGSQPTDLPRFSIGLKVRWSDGSEGQIVGRAEWRPLGNQGQWHYPVQFGGPDSLCWLLPEQGLQFVEEPSGISRR